MMLDHKKMMKDAMRLPIVSACSECRYVVKQKAFLDSPSFWQCGVTCDYASLRNKDGRCRDFEPAKIKSRKPSRGLGLGVVWLFVGAFASALIMIFLFNM